MATVERVKSDQRVTLHDIDWQTYVSLRDAPENYHVRMTYDQGELEMMSPSRLHERLAGLLGGLIEAWAEERGIDIGLCGAMTFQRKDLQRGLEPDRCYYVAHELQMREKSEVDLTVDPPPDLAIEVELGRGGARKLALYAKFRVPEVWRFDGRKLRFYTFGDEERYEERHQSPSFPDLPVSEIVGVLAQLGTASETALVRSFRRWVRSGIDET